MEDTKEIIRSIIDEAVAELMGVIADDIGKMSLSNIVQTTQIAVNKLGSRIVSQIVTVADELYNKRRDKHKITLRHTKTRRMASAMGEIELTRRLYFDKAAGKYFFAVDELLGIEKYSRIEGELKAQLINNATLTSYGKASKIAKDKVSRQTVCNLVKHVREQDLMAQSGKLKKVDNLFIEADEDHIHLNDGKSTEVKLVYVHEGRRKVNNGRMELINPKYFAAVQGGTDIWNTVADYVFMQYNVPMSGVRISGDGATWIKAGLNEFPGAQFFIDKFHVFKNVTDVSSGNLIFRNQVIDSIKRGDKDAVSRLYFDKLINRKNILRKRMVDSLNYLNNNFEDIDLLAEYGCSAEGHVSHVLSARMSSRPMAWGIAGADKMAKLRAFYFNGGDFTKLLTRGETIEEKANHYNLLPIRKKINVDGSIPTGHFFAESCVLEEIKKILRGEPKQSEIEAEKDEF